MLDYLTNYTAQNISITTLVFSIILAGVMSLIVVWLYRFTHRGMVYDRTFLITLLLMGPIIAVIITVIGNNIALSIGLVGSLSIVRFRTVIKDSRDLIYLLWGIAIGLGFGTNNWLAIISSSAVIATIILLVHQFRYGFQKEKNFILVIGGANRIIEKKTKDILIKNNINFFLRSMDKTSNNDWQVVLEIMSKDEDTINRQKIMDELEIDQDIKNVSLLAPNLTLPI